MTPGNLYATPMTFVSNLLIIYVGLRYAYKAETLHAGVLLCLANSSKYEIQL
jgi:hypothetical protein